MAPPTPIYDYCSLDDLTRLGGGDKALRGVAVKDRQAAITAASRRFDSYLKGAEFTLPLTAVGDEVKQAIAVVAFYTLMTVNGYNPNDPAHEIIRLNYEDQLKWFDRVSTGAVIPTVTDSGGATEAPTTGGVPVVITNSQRGWEDDRGGAFSGGRR